MNLLSDYKKMKKIENVIDVLIENIESMNKTLREISSKLDELIELTKKK